VLIVCHISKGVCHCVGRAPSFGSAEELPAGEEVGAAAAAGALAGAMINAELVEEETLRAVAAG
jgi:hypothetical protein